MQLILLHSNAESHQLRPNLAKKRRNLSTIAIILLSLAIDAIQ